MTPWYRVKVQIGNQPVLVRPCATKEEARALYAVAKTAVAAAGAGWCSWSENGILAEHYDTPGYERRDSGRRVPIDPPAERRAAA
jgi:hypothetical protein